MTQQPTHRAYWLDRLQNRAARLARLAELDAPNEILTNELELVVKALMEVDPGLLEALQLKVHATEVN